MNILRLEDKIFFISNKFIKKVLKKIFNLSDVFVNEDVIEIRAREIEYISSLNIFEIFTFNKKKQPIFIYINQNYKYVLIYDGKNRLSFQFEDIFVKGRNVIIFVNK